MLGKGDERLLSAAVATFLMAMAEGAIAARMRRSTNTVIIRQREGIFEKFHYIQRIDEKEGE